MQAVVLYSDSDLNGGEFPKQLALFYGALRQTGNAEKAALMAGYSPKYARASAYKMLARKDVQQYIEYLLHMTAEDPLYHIADIKEIQDFWTRTMNDNNIRVRDRLKASELLAKVQGAFKQEDDW